MKTEAEQFYCNYEFSDQKVNDCGDLNEERLTELMEAYHQSRVKAISDEMEELELCISECELNTYNEGDNLNKVEETKDAFNILKEQLLKQ